MAEKSRRFGTGVLRYKTGCEGPRHDPYSYEEWSITRHGKETTLHLGLAEWVAEEAVKHEATTTECIAKFEAAAGISLKSCEKAMHRWLPCCASPMIETFSGYPGETISRCAHCGAYVGYEFSESAVL